MSSTSTSVARRRRRTAALAVCAVGGAALGGVAAYQSTAAAPQAHASATATSAPHPRAAASAAPKKPHLAHADTDEKPTGSGSGVVTVFDDAPTVTHLDPALLAALRKAGRAAEKDGLTFVVDSGWRSAADQAQLLEDAVRQYGSLAAAERWVATPDTSEHVKGDAVDLGPVAARAWLSKHGAAYGLCQIYANESWHYELRPAAAHGTCPAMYADPTHDPRMQR